MISANESTSSSPDLRLYAPRAEEWDAHVKKNSLKEYCYYKAPGEEHFHLLIGGEIYLTHGSEKVCLNCAIRQGFLTSNRLHWQEPKKNNKKLKEKKFI